MNPFIDIIHWWDLYQYNDQIFTDDCVNFSAPVNWEM